uniref:Methyltransferase n=1 Tax=viral metagenome TaxID=1070528 RepID=A0A6H1ZXZ7_9ZZZZ
MPVDVVETMQGALFSEQENRATVRRGPVASRFVLPPFTVLDARCGDWQERKRAWMLVGIRGEVGRQDALPYTGPARSFDFYRVKEGTRATTDEQGTSIFDPTICELAYRWFCPTGGQVVDPFAGGSVRGIVASLLGLRYWGCDLRQEQIDANRDQLLPCLGPQTSAVGPCPEWVCADALDAVPAAPMADLVFSCPPYGDLERYSDDPHDLSTMEWHTFAAAYKRIILRCVERLRADRFACFVVGNFRDPRGFYRDLVGETVRGFEECGMHYYNEAVLVTSVGSGSMRVSKQFKSGRKLCKCHQNVLVFIKGDPRKAAQACRRIEEDTGDDQSSA